MKFDCLIKGGLVVDGTGGTVQKLDIGITGDRIAAVGSLSGLNAEKILDATGLHVSPGFIDSHSHSDLTIIADRRAHGKICQGVTTEVNGNCGFSAAPVYGDVNQHRSAELEDLGIKEKWKKYSEYFEILNNMKFAVNTLNLVGHGNLRASAAGYSDRKLTEHDKRRIFQLLGDAFDDGAAGLSTGLIYPPGIYSDTEELIEITGEALKLGGAIYATHMRSEGDELLEAVDEVIRIGLETGIHVHISHLKASDEKNWAKLDTVLEKISEARQKGLSLTCDRYPYIASSTGLDAMLPARVYEGGREKELMRLKNERDGIIREITDKHADESLWDKVMVSGVRTAQNKWMEGKTLSEIGDSLKKSPADCLIQVLIEEDLQVDAIFFLMNEDNLKTILKLPYSMIGTDSSARSFDGITASGKPHPRGFGTFPRILGRYVREEQILTVEDAVYKMTGLPAETFGIKNRGRIAQDHYADITVFDLNKIYDTADYNDPFQAPTGIEAVFVNGRPVVWEGRPTDELPGKIIKRGDR